MCVGVVTGDPRGSITSALTLFPFSSPVLMPMRYLLDGVGTGELLLSLVVLVATIVGTVWLAAKIYRLGILLTGKRPSLREVVRWLRHD
jgi:ABC-2 type transport system permease protein